MAKLTEQQLMVVIEVNEILKDLRRLSSSVNLEAINATLLSRRADRGRRNGFTVVADAIQQFAIRLDEKSRSLLKEIQILVTYISQQSKYERMTHFYQKLSQRELENKLVNQILEKFDTLNSQRTNEMKKLAMNIAAMAYATRRLCDSHHILYRNAKVEIAYLKAYHQELSLVANKIEQAIITASRQLKRLLSLIQTLL